MDFKYMKHFTLILLLIYYGLISYLNEWVAINQPLYYKYNITLKDIIQEKFPIINSLYPDIFVYFFIIYFIFRFSTINVWFFSSFLAIHSFLLTIRIIVFTVTKIPPSIKNCTNKFKWGHKWLFFYDNHSCGDYMFSNHSVYLTLITLFFIYFSSYLSEKILFSILSIIGYFLIIISRYHYSSDVLIGALLSILSFFSFKFLCRNNNFPFCFPHEVKK